MSSHYYEPVAGSPGTLSGCVPTSTSNGYFTPVSTPSSRDSPRSVRGNYSAGTTTPKKESPPTPRFRRTERSSPTAGHGVNHPPASSPSATPVFKRVGTFPTIIHQDSPPGRPRTRSEVALPVYVPNPPPTPPYSTPSRSSKRRSQLARRSQGSTGSRSPVRIIQGDTHSLVRTPSPIEIAIPPPMVGEKPIYSQIHSYQKSDVSVVYPLPATVYVPGEGDEEDELLPEREDDPYELHMQRPNHNRVYRTSPESMQGSTAAMSSFQVPSLPTSHHLDSLDAFLPPRRALSYGEPTQADLVGLWAAAQGAKRIPGTQNGAGKTFVLNMYRQAPLEHPNPVQRSLLFPEHFTFGTSPNNPFYAIYAMRETSQDETFNELTLLRRDPTTGVDRGVITFGLEPPSRRISPAGDGLITLIYPKEAVLSAMSPGTPLTRSGNTNFPTTAPQSRTQESRAKAAIQKAYATECCRLSWNAQRRRYYLYHPGVAEGGDAYLVDITGEVGFDHLGAKGSIKLVNVDTNETIVELDFARSLLFVNTRATGKIPNDYIVDVAVCAVLTVATVEGRRMRIVRRSQSGSSTTMSGLGKWGDEGSIDERERGGCWGSMASWFGKLFKRGGGVKHQSA